MATMRPSDNRKSSNGLGVGNSAHRTSLMQIAPKKRKSSLFEDATTSSLDLTSNRRGTIFSKPTRKPALAAVFEDDITETGDTIAIHKDARRRTIWVPSDDTTVMTIHPGAQTRTLMDETIALARLPLLPETTGLTTTKARRSSLFQAPKRAPLSNVKRPSTNSILVDIAGCPTGKENCASDATKLVNARKVSSVAERRVPECLKKSVVATQSRMSPQERQRPLGAARTSISYSRPPTQSKATKVSKASEFPVLEEDLQHPELFEDCWLAHQETSLSQVVNDIFDQQNIPESHVGSLSHRSALLEFYQQSHFVELRKRLTASVQTGALSLPKACEIPRLQEDVGLRRSFVKLWLDTYDLHKLWAAAEVISARVCKAPALGIEEDVKGLRKVLARFLLSVLVTCDNPSESRLVAWQLTVVRSLLIISLLDQSHAQDVLSGCLFLEGSRHKSSETMLRAIAALVLPSVGDITRTLGYLGYGLSYVQSALQEYSYKVTNLATDLRDGVLLARLLEVLMYNQISNATQTITLNLPSGDSLESMLSSKIRPLSQHLKYPSPTRAQQLYNVQISLSALETGNGLTQTAVSTIQAADIVDGHRERTLSFLWAIISRWGLHTLIPVASLRAEIKRHMFHLSYEQLTSAEIADFLSSDNDDDLASPDQLASLLKSWAAVICAHHQVTINNFTTSFATPDALAAIVDTYAACVPAQSGSAISAHKTSLQAKLKSLGCSTAFVQLFANESHIPTKATTLCLLAFLASRLIPLTRRLRAAETLQRVWRSRLARFEMHKRVVVLKVAHQCAEVVRARHRVEWAVVVLQRSWREMRLERMKRAERRIERFQAAARGWATRRALMGVLPSLRRNVERARGGW
ncbi:hypothetical protein K461DRAFT_276560 [Myriangium duriaei CBS 260.36]|uniref:Calponin-homology (CH) domain-containing protein n=1 Tax=Myriangium duriaei CBS 260.36 TaxID=1168546 RepID=A0A9P4J639_9PEZI|nr:hypothetical protein K461DRAFT_276560 [Myriangium duriaei CBS 260.36]